MFLQFLFLEWKRFIRQASLRQSIVIKSILLLFALGISWTLWQFGQQLYDLLETQSDTESPFYAANRLVALWFAVELSFRFFMQQLPVVDSKPFLLQPIGRGKLTHYLLIKSVFSFYNLLTPLLFIPFASACVSEGDFSAWEISTWLAGVIMGSWCLHFLNFLIQQKVTQNWRWALSAVIAAAAIYGLSYYKVFTIPNPVSLLYNQLPDAPWLLAIPFALLIGSYILVQHTIASRLYLDVKSKSTPFPRLGAGTEWTSVFGVLAPYIALDLRLLMRNKRSRSHLITLVIALVYGLVFYREGIGQSGIIVFIGIFMTGAFMFNFGQFIPAWDSGYYPFVHTQPISFVRYLGAKANLLYSSVVLSCLLTLPYAFIDTDYLWVNTSCAIYNMGINVPIILYFGSANRKRLALDQSQMFNYQGVGAVQWLLTLPGLLIPLIIWLVAKGLSDSQTANLVLASMGVVGLAGHRFVIRRLARKYNSNKYLMLEGFKET